MSRHPKYGRYCDECGRTIKKAHRVFENKDYCSVCYPRVFISKACIRCGRSARVHRLSSESPLCSKCVRIGRVCVRCEKPIIKAGMISGGKPVCPSCVLHFKEVVPCASCAVPSARLSAMPSAGIYEKICDSCRNKVTHKTCSICRKYRKVVGITVDGKPYCQACTPGKSVAHLCPDCGIEVPGNGASKCRVCLNRIRLFKEVELNELMLTREWTKMLYRQFAQWIFERQPQSSNLINVYRSHQIFFERIDAQFHQLANLTGPAILEVFGTSDLRKHLLATQFLTEALALKITPKEKTEYADLERIRNKLLESRKSTWGKTLEQFALWLEDSRVPVRTRRLYLTTAETFCKFVKLNDKPWSDDELYQFLRAKPGLRANLFKFVGYCRHAYGWNITMPPRGRSHTKVNALPKTIPKLQMLLQKVAKEGLNQVDKGTLARIIAISLGFPLKIVLGLSSEQFRSESDTLVLKVNGESVIIPTELDSITHEFIMRL